MLFPILSFSNHKMRVQVLRPPLRKRKPWLQPPVQILPIRRLEVHATELSVCCHDKQGALVSPDIAEPLTTVSDNSEMDAYFSIDENAFLTLIQRFGSTENFLKDFPKVALLLNDGSTYGHEGKWKVSVA